MKKLFLPFVFLGFKLWELIVFLGKGLLIISTAMAILFIICTAIGVIFYPLHPEAITIAGTTGMFHFPELMTFMTLGLVDIVLLGFIAGGVLNLLEKKEAIMEFFADNWRKSKRTLNIQD